MEPAIDHPSIFNPSTLVKKGYCACATSPDRAPQPHKCVLSPDSTFHKLELGRASLYYELHGAREDVRERIVLIMGLNASSFSWSNNLSYFAELPHYQVLAFDNRGVGLSDAPTSSRRYKTSEMAQDTIELLDHLDWTDKHSVHVVGVSMGGMIAQHVALLATERVASLVLISTTSDNRQLAPLKGIKMILTNTLLPTFLGGPSTPEQQISLVVSTLFPESYLAEELPDPSDRASTITQRQRMESDLLHRFNITRLQTPAGRMGQMAAAMTHCVSPEECARLAKEVPKILIVTGDDDNLVDSKNSYTMNELMPGSELIVWEKAGHALPSQCADKLNAVIKKTIEEARSLCS